MANNKSIEYWRKRYKLVEEQLYSQYAYNNVEEIQKIFNNSLTNINKEIAIWLQRFADNNSITYTEATKLISTKELEELGWNVSEYVKKGIDNSYTRLWDKELENASAKFHITRLEALKLQVVNICENMFTDLGGVIEKALKSTYTEGYYGTAYEIAQGFNVGVNVAKINENLLNKIINKPWSDDGVEFSERIWGKYRPTLVNRLHKDLTDCIIRGINPKTLAANYAKEFKVSENAATNLLMTEYSQFAALSNTDCLNDLDVEEYEIIATLDSKTCSVCQKMDKKHFPMSELVVGANAPPFHNRCRCTKCPYFDDEFTANIKRAARDPETGETIYIDDMSYTDWKERFVTEKGQQAWDYYEKSVKNKAADTKQYNKYKSVLGKNAPKSLEEFQKLKYTDSEEWENLKYYYRNIDDRPVEYVKIDRELEKAGILNRGKAFPFEDVELNNWNVHAENRLKQRNISKKEATEYKNSALLMMKKYPEPNTQNNYYSEDGVIGIRISDKTVCTTYSKDDFKGDTLKILEVAKKWLK